MLPAMVEALARRGWSERNHAVLGDWLAGHARLAASGGAPARAAVFDWDDTCLFRCAGTATFRHQLDALALRVGPEEVAELVPERVDGVDRFAAGPTLAEVRRAVLDAYERLWPDVERDDGERARARFPDAHRDFRALVGWLYDAYEATPGIGARFAYPWMARWLGGHTPGEVGALALEAFDRAAAEPIGRLEWTSDALGPSAPVRYAVWTGIAAVPEMRELMAAAAQVGVVPHVVTASHEHVVRAVSRAQGFVVAPERVLGIRLAEGADGRLAPIALDEPRHPITHGPGKVAMVRARVSGAPVLVCGDTDGDFDMLTSFAETQVRLVIDRARVGRIEELYRAGRCRDGTAPWPGHTLVQARDERRGCFDPEERAR